MSNLKFKSSLDPNFQPLIVELRDFKKKYQKTNQYHSLFVSNVMMVFVIVMK